MDSPFLGMVQYFAFDWAPRGYAVCNGALLAISTNAALFSLLGTQYGGNGVTTFALPDLRGRAVRGQGSVWTMGEIVGTPTATMLTSNMPAHTHTATVQIAANNTTALLNDPTNAVPAVTKLTRGPGSQYAATGDGTFLGAPSVVVGVSGSTIPFSITNPYLAVGASIALQGIFPSRN